MSHTRMDAGLEGVVSVMQADAAAIAKRLIRRQTRGFDAMLVDPPRQVVERVVGWLDGCLVD